MSDLWDWAEPEEEQALSDSSGEEAEDLNDTDFLLPKSKRRKLQGRGSKRSGGAGSKAQAAQGPEDGEADSDIELLNSSPEPHRAAAAAAAVPQARLTNLQQPAAGRRAALDPRTAELLQKLKATQAAIEQVAQEVDLAQGDSEEEDGGSPGGGHGIDPSPVRLRHAGNWGARRQHQQQGGAEDEEDAGFEILGETLPQSTSAAAAPAAAEDKIRLKLQSAKGVKELKMRRTDPFQKMFDVYKKFALEQGWIPSLEHRVRFNFDGDDVAPDDTPEGLDLEGDEMIEVRF